MTQKTSGVNHKQVEIAQKVDVYCPICTHTVQAEAIAKDRRLKVKSGQKCARCGSQLDAGYVFSSRAA